MKAKIKLKMTECASCGAKMPVLRRTQYGYKDCVKCSDVQPYGCVHITNHKTGNEIQILPAELAERINKLAERTGYGVLKSMKAPIESK